MATCYIESAAHFCLEENDVKTRLEVSEADPQRNRSKQKVTRPEVSKLTPKNKINSQVTKLRQAVSSEATNRLTDIKKLY